MCRLLRETIRRLPGMGAEVLACAVAVRKTAYSRDIPQKFALQQLKAKGVEVMPGQVVHYVHQEGGVVLPEDYDGRPDMEQYRKMLLRSLFILLQPFGFKREQLESMASDERQTSLAEHFETVFHYVPMRGSPTSRVGLAERQLCNRLEKQGWMVWRGGALNILKKEDNYPNVKRKYHLLMRLLDRHMPGKREQLQYLCHVHHGMPDFLCYRLGEFKFVECKLCHEQLSLGQKKCIARLQQLGFTVEVHKLVDERTKARVSRVSLATGRKSVVERQTNLACAYKKLFIPPDGRIRHGKANRVQK
jgi:hypothetical protein